MVMLATRPVMGKTTLGRETFLARVIWEDGWPVVNPGLGIMTREVIIDLPEFSPECDSRNCPLSDKHYEFAGMDKLPTPFIMLRNPSEDMYKFSNDGIEIKCATKRSYVALRQDAHNFDAVAVLRTKDLYNGARAGLMLMQSDDYQLRIDYAGMHATAILKKNGAEEKLGSCMAAYDNVTLLLTVKGLNASIFVGEGNKVTSLVKDIDISALSTEVAGGFVGCTVGIFADNVEKDSELNDEIYATFKSLSYRPIVNNR